MQRRSAALEVIGPMSPLAGQVALDELVLHGWDLAALDRLLGLAGRDPDWRAP